MPARKTSKPDLEPLRRWHRVFDRDKNGEKLTQAIKWRLVEQGIETSDKGVERTPGAPATVGSIWRQYKREIVEASEETGVPVELIIATIATESGGRSNAVRREPGYTGDNATPHRVSVGLMQTLISTARATMRNNRIGRKWLTDPGNSILAGCSYIAQQASKTKLDPPVVACAYNAGSVYRQTGRRNRWVMRQYPIGTAKHADRFVKWFNDSIAMLATSGDVPRVSFTAWLGAAEAFPGTPTPETPETPPHTPPAPPRKPINWSKLTERGIIGLLAGAFLALMAWIFGFGG